MEKARNWQGCGGCKLCRERVDCRSYTKKIQMEFIKSEKWDNWGKMVTAFRKGTVIQGTAVIKDGVVYCASAESSLYQGITDFVNLENIKILEEEEPWNMCR